MEEASLEIDIRLIGDRAPKRCPIPLPIYDFD
jgi:hypothetical protein